MRKAILGFAAVVVSLLVLAGCGDDSSTISQEEYERQIELVCNKSLQSREELFGQLTQEYEEIGEENVTAKYEEENLRKLYAQYEETTEEIDEIGLPEGNEEKAEELVREREEAAAKVQASPLGTRDSLSTIFEKPGKLAESLGAEGCGS
ncbi:MAG TPA: hypothetical protein VFM51_10915 [Solirubrobacterales bacterium]|nr:hypothetical protein [Solirubrobacterales bacterium]